ncbi:conserved protein of unknown function [Ectopseudomonas oleovorans]|uniref:Uncharacterized protein n=1 Tax=Ectopseudomonas oleovorans TaxID=301 RepID=A0A653BB57_ECTOL|nr:conserved protein of unknown function [Pseudomonas oleovorans]
MFQLTATLRGLAHAHEGADHVGDGLLGVILIGVATGEDDVGGHAIALGETEHILARLGGMHVVDAQVQRRADLELGQHAHGGNATGGVHQRGDRPAMDDAGIRIANDVRRVRQAQGQALAVSALDRHAEHLTMTQCSKKPLRAILNRLFTHLSTPDRTSSNAWGTPDVRMRWTMNRSCQARFRAAPARRNGPTRALAGCKKGCAS